MLWKTIKKKKKKRKESEVAKSVQKLQSIHVQCDSP